jgi:hypothetical protein
MRSDFLLGKLSCRFWQFHSNAIQGIGLYLESAFLLDIVDRIDVLLSLVAVIDFALVLIFSIIFPSSNPLQE